MCEYYIKIVWGPSKGYPQQKLIHFVEEKSCSRFSKCKGFLLYEDGKEENGERGYKSIYAQGVINKKQPDCFYSPSPVVRGKKFFYAVKVSIKKRIDPKNGIRLEEVRKIIKRTIIRQRGGLVKITKEQYKKLCKILNYAKKII